MRLIIVLFCLFLLVGCASQQPQVIKHVSPIYLPKAPEVVAIETDKLDKSKYPNTKWVSKPTIIDPDPVGKGRTWQAPKEGAIAWSYKDWNTLDYGITEWTKYGQTLRDIIKKHNDNLVNKDQSDNEKKSKWIFWK